MKDNKNELNADVGSKHAKATSFFKLKAFFVRCILQKEQCAAFGLMSVCCKVSWQTQRDITV